nr:MAG TPA: hypothetical protein [Caudoviricetes sp.]
MATLFTSPSLTCRLTLKSPTRTSSVSRSSTTCATLAALAARLTRTTASSRITRGR